MRQVRFAAEPSSYKHWQLEVRDGVATLGMKVQEDCTLDDGYALKLNSYDLGVSW